MLARRIPVDPDCTMRKILKASLIAAVALSATVATPAATPPLPSTDAEIAALNIKRDEFHGEWNYTISPRQASP